MSSSETRESVVLENFGQKIFGILHRPVHIKKYPVILMCHGLAGHKTGKYRLYVNLSEMLSKRGIASLRIDFRGSGDSEGDFGDMTLEGEVSDALKALEFLEKDGHFDQSRIGLFGRSIGGTVALMAARRHGQIKSIVTWAPLFNTVQWEEKWKLFHAEKLSQEHRHDMIRINGQIPGYDFLKQLFNMCMEDELKDLESAPLLHIQGELDNIITVEHADRFLMTRQTAKGKNKFIRLPGCDHDFSDPKEQLFAMQETCQWFTDTLKA